MFLTYDDSPVRVSPWRRGFTLVELAVASAISTILLLAIASAIVLASKALPESSPAMATTEGVQAAGLLSADLAHAKSIVRASTKGIEFTVADRDGDAADERIAYDWDGHAGSPVTRSVNGSSGELVADASGFALSLGTTVEGEAPRTLQQSTAEQTVFAANAGSAYAFTVNGSSPIMEGFKAALPAGATTWTIERIDVYMTSSGSRSASLIVAIYELGLLGSPTGSALAVATIDETSMPTSFGWFTLPLGRVQGLDPSKKYVLICAQSSSTSGDAATMAYLNISSSEGAANGSLYSRVLALWVQDTGKRLAMQVRATAVVSVTTPDTRRTVVKEVGVELKPAGALNAITSGVKLLNEPEAP